MKKDFEYIILTPIAPHKRYSLDRFIKNVAAFNPLPKKIVFCCEPEDIFEISEKKQFLAEKGIGLVIFTLGPETIKEYGATELGRVREGRNTLRSFFLSSEFDWALLLDSDIIPNNPQTPLILHEVAKREEALTVINQCPGREEGPIQRPEKNGKIICSGVALSLIHRSMINLVEFHMAPIVWNNEFKMQLSEDFNFLAVLKEANEFVKICTGLKSCIIGRFVPVIHEVSPGVDKTLDI